MLGDRVAQQKENINTSFVMRLIPAMRKSGVKHFLYQAGGLSGPPDGQLSWFLWFVRKTIARPYEGQHRDNEAVMEYSTTQARDIEWVVHRAGIGSDGSSKGTLQRSSSRFSLATFRDCAEYSYRTVQDDSAVHTMDFSCYS